MANDHSQKSDRNGASEITPLVVVMVPLPAQGHLNQLLHLSRLISARNIPVHFAASATHNRQARTRAQGLDPQSITNITFNDLPCPPFSNPNPDPNVNFPSQIIPALVSTKFLRVPVYDLVRDLSANAGKLVVIYDCGMAHVVQDIYSIANVESYSLQSISAFSLYSFYWEFNGKAALPTEAEVVSEGPSMEGCFVPEFFEFTNLQTEANKSSSGDLYNTSRLIEGFYVDQLANEKTTGTDKNWAIGPFNPVSMEKHTGKDRSKCLEWLDKQGLNSVIFVSFGTTSCLSHEQIVEIALGLERSEQKFVWVLRDADKGDIFAGEVRKLADSLPEGFEERVRERGIVVRSWAPQLEILGHPATGGFLSHCGWNSCMESISMGVPIVTWPMHSDQPRNAVLVTKVLRVGIELKDWARRGEVISSGVVATGVRRLMATDEGDEIRRRAGELGDAVRRALREGGDTRKEMDSFIAHITR